MTVVITRGQQRRRSGYLAIQAENKTAFRHAVAYSGSARELFVRVHLAQQ
jgi:hypothetical protein